MDYLREGIHLRGFAQIDPLVAYKNEGFAMFEELMHSIWEEFSKLIFNAQIEIDPSQVQEGAFAANGGGGTALDYSGGTADAQPSALQEVAAGVSVTEGTARPSGGNGAPPAEVIETVVKDERENIGRNDPCWCGSGKKYKKCHGA
jgi:preprotein translocase subunit SecA